MNENFKLTISRSFTRKVNLGNYESADFWGAYSLEVPSDIKPSEAQAISQELYERAKADVEQAIEDYKNARVKAEELKNAEIKAETIKRIDQKGWPKESKLKP